MSFSIENILDKVIFCTRLYPGYPGNMPIKNPKPGGLNTRLIGHLIHKDPFSMTGKPNFIGKLQYCGKLCNDRFFR